MNKCKTAKNRAGEEGILLLRCGCVAGTETALTEKDGAVLTCNVPDYWRAALAVSTREVKAVGSLMAISESIFLLSVTPAFLRPFMN